MYSESTGQIKGKVTVPKGVSKKVLYSSSNKKVATINSAGKVKSLKPGKTYITLTLAANKKIKKKVLLTVVQRPKKLAINTKSVSLKEEDTYQLVVKVTPKSDDDKVVFKSSNTKVATVDSNGKVTAVKEGQAVIEVTLVDTEKKVSCTVIVKDKSITLGESEIELFVEDTYLLKPIVLPKSITNVITYKSSDSSVAKVNELGLIEAVAEGEATTEALLVGTDKKAYCKVIVKNKEEESDATIARAPVTKEELEAKFPKEPTYPSLKLKSADMEVALKADLSK